MSQLPSSIAPLEQPKPPPASVRLGLEFERRGLQAPPAVKTLTNEYRRRGLVGMEPFGGGDADVYDPQVRQQLAGQRVRQLADEYEPPSQAARAEHVSKRMDDWLGSIAQTASESARYAGEHFGYEQRQELWRTMDQKQVDQARERFGQAWDRDHSTLGEFERQRDEAGQMILEGIKHENPGVDESEAYKQMHEQLTRLGYTPDMAGQLDAVTDEKRLEQFIEGNRWRGAPLVDRGFSALGAGDAVAGFLQNIPRSLHDIVGEVGVGSIATAFEKKLGTDLGLRSIRSTMQEYYVNRPEREGLFRASEREGPAGEYQRFAHTIGAVGSDLAATMVLTGLGAGAAKWAGMAARLQRTAGTLAGMGYMGAREGGMVARQTYATLLAQGLSHEEANDRAMIAGVAAGSINALIERIPIQSFMFRNPQMRNRLTGAMHGMIAEGTTEAAQEFVQIAAEFEAGAGEGVWNWDAAKQIMLASLAGGVVGGGVGAYQGGEGALSGVEQQVVEERRRQIAEVMGQADRAEKQRVHREQTTSGRTEARPDAGPTPTPDSAPTTGPVDGAEAQGARPASRHDPKVIATPAQMASWFSKEFNDPSGGAAISAIMESAGERFRLVDIPIGLLDVNPLGLDPETAGIESHKVDAISAITDQELADLPPIIATGQPGEQLQVADGTHRTEGLRKRGGVSKIRGYVPESVAKAITGVVDEGATSTRPEGEGAAPTTRPTPGGEAGRGERQEGQRPNVTPPEGEASASGTQQPTQWVDRIRRLAGEAEQSGDRVRAAAIRKDLEHRIREMEVTKRQRPNAWSEGQQAALDEAKGLHADLAGADERIQRQRTEKEREQAEARARKAEESFEREYDLRRRDPLTGIYNRLGGDEAIETMITQAEAENVPVAMVGIDLVLFKQVNDAISHEAGDNALVAAAEAMESSVRSGGDGRQGDAAAVVTRRGGDEFEIVLWDVTPEQVVVVGERMSQAYTQAMEAQGVQLPPPLKTLLAYGFTIRKPRDERSLSELRHDADMDLEVRKNQLKRDEGLPEGRAEPERIIKEAKEQGWKPPEQEPEPEGDGGIEVRERDVARWTNDVNRERWERQKARFDEWFDDHVQRHGEVPFEALAALGDRVIVTRSTKPGQSWQATLTSSDGTPADDLTSNSYRDLLRDAQRAFGMDIDTVMVVQTGEQRPQEQESEPAEAKPAYSFPPFTEGSPPDVLRIDGQEPRTGEPISAELFHGSGREDASQVYAAGADGPAFGAGRYYAITEADARAFGPDIDAERVTLQNPLVISSTKELAEWMDVGPIPTTVAGWNEVLPAVRRKTRQAGHDGLVVNVAQYGDMNNAGDSVKKLRDLAGTTQVVVFEPDTATREKIDPDIASLKQLIEQAADRVPNTRRTALAWNASQQLLNDWFPVAKANTEAEQLAQSAVMADEPLLDDLAARDALEADRQTMKLEQRGRAEDAIALLEERIGYGLEQLADKMPPDFDELVLRLEDEAEFGPGLDRPDTFTAPDGDTIHVIGGEPLEGFAKLPRDRKLDAFRAAMPDSWEPYQRIWNVAKAGEPDPDAVKTMGYSAGHEFYYHHGGKVIDAARIIDTAPRFEVSEIKLVKSEKVNQRRLEEALYKERDRLENDRADYKSLAEQGPAALLDLGSGYDFTNGNHQGEPPEVMYARAIGFRHNWIQHAAGRIKWLESQLGIESDPAPEADTADAGPIQLIDDPEVVAKLKELPDTLKARLGAILTLDESPDFTVIRGRVDATRDTPMDVGIPAVYGWWSQMGTTGVTGSQIRSEVETLEAIHGRGNLDYLITLNPAVVDGRRPGLSVAMYYRYKPGAEIRPELRESAGVDRAPGEAEATTEPTAEPEAEQLSTMEPNPKRAAQFRKLAEGMQGQIDNKMNPGVSQQNWTNRRARIAESMRNEGEALQQLQAAMRAMADAFESGDMPASLRAVTTKAQIETLLRNRTSPDVAMRDNQRDDLLKAGEGKAGVNALREAVAQLQPRGASSRMIDLADRPQVIEAMQEFARRHKNDTRVTKAWNTIKGELAEGQRLQKGGIQPDQFTQARADLLGMFDADAMKQAASERKAQTERDNKLRSRRAPGYFPTPPSVARAVIWNAEIEPHHTVLEPSAGEGALLRAVEQSTPGIDRSQIQAVEIAPDLVEHLANDGWNVRHGDFEALVNELPKFDRIVMNPPFEHQQDIAHVRAAYSALKPGGRLVAVMSEGTFSRSTGEAPGFREWLEEIEGVSEKVPEGAFAATEAMRQTGVATRIVTINKPAAAEAESFTEPADTGRRLTADQWNVAQPGDVIGTETPRKVIARRLKTKKRADEIAMLTGGTILTDTPRTWAVWRAVDAPPTTESTDETTDEPGVPQAEARPTETTPPEVAGRIAPPPDDSPEPGARRDQTPAPVELTPEQAQKTLKELADEGVLRSGTANVIRHMTTEQQRRLNAAMRALDHAHAENQLKYEPGETSSPDAKVWWYPQPEDLKKSELAFIKAERRRIEKQFAQLAKAKKPRPPKPGPKGRKNPTKPSRATGAAQIRKRVGQFVKNVHTKANVSIHQPAVNIDQDGRRLTATDGSAAYLLTARKDGWWGEDGTRTMDANGAIGVAVDDKSGDTINLSHRIIADAEGRLGEATTIDIVQAVQQLRKAMIVQPTNVVVVVNPDGSLGFASGAAYTGIAEVNVQTGAREAPYTATPRILIEALEFAYAIGADTARVRILGVADPNKPGRAFPAIIEAVGEDMDLKAAVQLRGRDKTGEEPQTVAEVQQMGAASDSPQYRSQVQTEARKRDAAREKPTPPAETPSPVIDLMDVSGDMNALREQGWKTLTSDPLPRDQAKQLAEDTALEQPEWQVGTFPLGTQGLHVLAKDDGGDGGGGSTAGMPAIPGPDEGGFDGDTGHARPGDGANPNPDRITKGWRPLDRKEGRVFRRKGDDMGRIAQNLHELIEARRRGEDLNAGDTIYAIIDDLARRFNVGPSAIGRDPSLARSAAGLYELDGQRIRLRKGSYIATWVHELGHHLHQVMFPRRGSRKLSAAEPTITAKDFPQEWQKDLIQLGKDLYGKRQPNVGGYTSEGWAEVVRFLFVNPAHLKKRAPQVYADVVNMLVRDHPDIWLMIREGRVRLVQAVERMGKDPVDQYVAHERHHPRSWRQRGNTLIYEAVDDTNPIRVMLNDLGIDPDSMPADKNPHTSALRVRSYIAGDIRAAIEDGIFDPADPRRRAHGPALREVLKRVGNDEEIRNWQNYMVARRVIEKRAQGYDVLPQDQRMPDHLTTANLNRWVKEIEQDKPHFADARKDFHTINRWLINDYAVHYGLITKEAGKLITDANLEYITFRWLKHSEQAKRTGKIAGRRMTGWGSGIKRFNPGKGEQLYPPLESFFASMQGIVGRARLNHVAKQVVLDNHNMPGAGRWFSKLTRPMDKTIINDDQLRDEIGKQLGIRISKDGAISLPPHLEGLSDDEVMALVESIEGMESATFWKPGRRTDAENMEVSILVKGKPQFYRITDSELYQTLEGMGSPATVGAFWRAMRLPATVLRQGATRLNPDFFNSNWFRDFWQSVTLSDASWKAVGEQFKRRWEGYRNVFRAGELARLFKISGGDMAAIWNEYYNPATSRFSVSEIRGDRIWTQLPRSAAQAKRMLADVATLGPIARINDALESSNRLAEFNLVYHNALGRGAEQAEAIAEAGQASADISLDYLRSGRTTRQINQFIVFFNAAIRGPDKMIRYFKKYPARSAGRMFAGMVVPSIMQAIANFWNDDYWSQPQEKRDRWWMFPIGWSDDGRPVYLTLPKPYGLATFSIATERSIARLLGIDPATGERGDPDAHDGMTWAILRELRPTFNLAGLQPLMEVAPPQGWSVFWGREIVPDRDAALPKQDQGAEISSTTAQYLGAMLNYPPAKIDYLIRNWFGGAASTGIFLGDRILETVGVSRRSGPPVHATDYPVIRRFISGHTRSEHEAIRRFYNDYQQMQATQRGLSWRMETRPHEVPNYRTVHEFELRVAPVYSSTATSMRQDFSELRRLYRSDDIDPDELDQRIDRIFDRIVQKAQNAHRRVRRIAESRDRTLNE